jgi:magnesium-transporting ATPase (P-type)
MLAREVVFNHGDLTEEQATQTHTDEYKFEQYQGEKIPLVAPNGGVPLWDKAGEPVHINTKVGAVEPLAETELTLIGVVSIVDPLRDGVPEAIAKCYTAGVDIRMVTGDNLRTAVSISDNAGILKEHHWNHVLDSKDSDGKPFTNKQGEPWLGLEGYENGKYVQERFSKFVKMVAEHKNTDDLRAAMTKKGFSEDDIHGFEHAVKMCRGIVINKNRSSERRKDFSSPLVEHGNAINMKEVANFYHDSGVPPFVSDDPLLYIRDDVAMEGTTFEKRVIYKNAVGYGTGDAPAENYYADPKVWEDLGEPDGPFGAGTFGQNGVMDSGNYNLDVIDEIWPRLRVMARCQPEHKLTLVTGMMQSRLYSREDKIKELLDDNIKIFMDGRQIVAVTGDGTNDAPSLKQADVGFAMGIAGTQVSQRACDIVLMDDNFASTVVAVKWGRNVYDSVCKFLQFQLTVNIVAIIVASLGAVVYQSSPLGAIQMLWVNLIMDSLGSLALATEKPTDALLLRHPYGTDKSMISNNMWFNMLGQSLYQLVIVLTIMFYGEYLFYVGTGDGTADSQDHLLYDPDVQFNFVPNNVNTTIKVYDDHLTNGRVAGCSYTQHYTCLFNSFVMMTLFNQVVARKLLNEVKTMFSGVFENPYFVTIVLVEFFLQIVFVQFLTSAVGCKALEMRQWAICIAFGVGTWPWQYVISLFYHCVKDKLPKTGIAHKITDKVPKVGGMGSRTKSNNSFARVSVAH